MTLVSSSRWLAALFALGLGLAALNPVYAQDDDLLGGGDLLSGDGLSGELLGFCGLKRSNEEPGPIGDHEAGWRLREDAWGKGYAKEAAIATLKVGFEQFDAPHILALTVFQNRPSWGLMEKLGMERRKDLDYKGTMFGEEDIIVYSITHQQWLAHNA